MKKWKIRGSREFQRLLERLKSDEKILHSKFAHCRIKSEWFNLNDNDINDISQYYNQKSA